MAKKLTESQYWELNNAYDEVIQDSNDFGVANGAHYLLIAKLNEFGRRDASRFNCVDIAEELLSNGYA